MFRPRRGPLLLTTFAISLAKRIFPEIHFVTDTRGAWIAEMLGWDFDRIDLSLDTWNTDCMSHIWALGKLVACLVQDKPFVQFDGDVLLFKPLPKHLYRSRLIAQSPDFPEYYTSDCMKEALGVAEYEEGTLAYNGGLLGGCDVALVRAYAWAGLDLARKFMYSAINGTVASMIVEQYQLGVFAKRTGVKVGTILPASPTEAQITKAGYAHLLGGSKHQKFWIEKVESRIAAQFPEAYERFLSGWPFIDSCDHPHPEENLYTCAPWAIGSCLE